MPNSNSEYLAEIRNRLYAVHDRTLDGPELQALVRGVQKVLRDGPFDADFGVCYNLSEYRDAYGDVYFPVYDLMDVVSAIYPGEKHPDCDGYWLTLDLEAGHWEGVNLRARYAFLEWLLEVLESGDAG